MSPPTSSVASSLSSKVSPTQEDHNNTTALDGSSTFTLVSSKGKRLFARRWEPPTTTHTRGLVFVAHGFGEHLAWYDPLATSLADRGLLVYGHDHVGHGKSEGMRGHVKEATEYSEDVLLHVNKMKEEHPDLPSYIVGHSMGGMIAVSTILSGPPDTFTGAVLMGPLILPDPKEATPMRIAAAKVVAWLFPSFPVSKLDEDLVTSDKEMLSKMAKDELRYRGGVRAQWACTCLDQVLQNKELLQNFNVPFLVLHGEKDGLCTLSGSKLLLEKAPAKDKKLKVFPGALHHLYIESSEIRREALADTVDWIVQHLPPQ